MYSALKIRPTNEAVGTTSLVASKGENRRDLPQFLDTKFALTIKNYLVEGDGQLVKRRGQTEVGDSSGTGYSMFRKFQDDLFIVGYGTSVKAFVPSTGTFTSIKTDFSTNTGFDGAAYGGDYFFVVNGVDNFQRISRTLAYDAQTANFTVGQKLTGGTSAATATILEDSDSGATGTLTLGNISGTFANNETITDSSTGSATADGVATWVSTAVSAAPVSSVIEIIGPRCFLGRLRKKHAGVAYSAVDDGTNPPFTNWTVSTTSTAAGEVEYRAGGAVTAIEPLGSVVNVFQDNGKFGFTIDEFDSNGTVVKKDTFVYSKRDFGGFRGALNTSRGLFYTNESGLWQMTGVGQNNVPFSDQEILTSEILGREFFDTIDFSDSDIIHDPKQKIIVVSCRQGSSANNHAICYNLDNGAFTEITNWTISRFINDNGTIYGASAGDGKIYKLFDRSDDDGLPIPTEFYQEINMGGLYTRKSLEKFYIQGAMSPSTSVNIYFDIYEPDGDFVQSKKTYTWTPSGIGPIGSGWDVAGFDTDGFDGAFQIEEDSLINSFSGCAPRINNLMRLRVRFTSSDQVPHRINFFSVLGREKTSIRRRDIILQ